MIIKNENNRRNPLIEIEIYPYLFKGYSIDSNDLSIKNTKFNKLSNILPRKISVNNLSKSELGALITKFSYSTSMSENGIGKFSVTLMTGKVNSKSQFFLSNLNKEVSDLANEEVNIFDYLTTSSLIKIWINGTYMMTGFINSVKLSIKNNPRKTTVLTGENVGSLLRQSIFYDLSQGGDGNILDNNYQSKGRAYNQKFNGSIVEMINSITDLWLNNILRNSQFKFATSDGGKTNILEHFNFNINETAKPYLNDFQWNPSLWDFEGEILEYINQLVSYPFNELYVVQGKTNITAEQKFGTDGFEDADVLELLEDRFNEDASGKTSYMANEKMYLILRKAPFNDYRYMDKSEGSQFSEPEFKDLIEFQINEKDVIEMNVERNNSSAYSYFSLYLQAQLASQDTSKILYPPNYNFGNLQKVGYKPLKIQLSSIQTITPSAKRTIKSFQQKARQWYAYNDFYLQGAISIKGFEKLIIGEKITIVNNQIKETELEAYITGYSHDWSLGGGFKTDVTISRGLYKEFLKLVGNTKIEFKKQKELQKQKIANIPELARGLA